ncbi:hypothetical protein L6164_010672 [Bauhinia variegata]|uniref:Uncharacterized protein n=1 Tax=Bauhinia variegata TaxID=167791 RepID=A0ACB9PP02_BAUVA|nr:hypothetical protein L6164_010672 [Bauhinia variegata]
MLNSVITSSRFHFPRFLSRWHRSSSPFPHSDSTNVYALHANSFKNGSLQTSNLSSYLLNLYVKSNNLDHAHKLFDEILLRNTQTWTILISGFARIGSSDMVFNLFREMRVAGALPNHFTLSSVFKCCSRVSNLLLGKGVHAWILRNGIVGDIVLNNSLLDFYLKCSVFEYAERLFELMKERDLVSCNIMIAAYIRGGDVEKSLDFFRNLPYKDAVSWNTIIDGLMQCGCERYAFEQLYDMVRSGTELSSFSFSIALMLASSLTHIELGRQLHERVLKFGINSDGFIRSSLVEMYCKCGRVDKASLVLREVPLDFLSIQNSGVRCEAPAAEIVSWSSMVSGYILNGKYEDGLKSFRFMVRKQVAVDILTITSIISACTNAGTFEFGLQIHAYIQKIGHRMDAYVGSSLIDMYSKSGSLDDAWMIFRQINSTNVVLWTSMISGCALHGQGREAVRLFDEMVSQGIVPNEVTFLGVLNACSHAGLLDDGCRYFRMMKDVFCIDPGVEHFTSMVDLYGRAGHLTETKEFIFANGISHLSAVWKSFLSSCRLHKNVEMGKWVSEILLQISPSDAGTYILSSNMCAANHRWDEAARVRTLMHQKGIKKQPGQSWM